MAKKSTRKPKQETKAEPARTYEVWIGKSYVVPRRKGNDKTVSG
jgi:hypothetical protein